jgi:O-antigen ligase
LVSLIVGSAVVISSRMPWRRSVPLLAIVLPAFFMVFGGRQTNMDLDDSEDTFQGRVLLCRDAMVLFHSAPLFGIGYNMMADENGTVAHNSYAHTYAELGMFGGTIWVGMIYLAVTAIYQQKSKKLRFRSEEQRRWRSCVFAIIVAYAIGIWSLSRPYAIPTYLVIAIVATYCNIATTRRPPALTGVDQSFVVRLAKASIGCLIFLHLYVRFMLT